MRSLFMSRQKGDNASIAVDNYYNISETQLVSYPHSLLNSALAFNVIPMDIYIEELFIEVETAPGLLGTGKKFDITLIRNGIDTEITLSIFETMTTSTYTPATPLLLSKGDIVKYRGTPTNSPNTFNSLKSVFVIRTLNSNNFPILNSWAYVGSTGSYRYNALHAYDRTGSPTSNIDRYNSICTVSGTLKSLYVKLRLPQKLGTSTRFMVFKNKVATDLYVDITAGLDSGETIADVDVAQGDLFSFGHINLTGNPDDNSMSYGVVFRSDVDGEFPLFPLAVTNNPVLHTTNSDSLGINTINFTGGDPTTVTNIVRSYINYDIKLKNFFIQLGTAPGVGKSRSFAFYKNSVSQGTLFTISGTDVSGNNITDEVQYVQGDYALIGTTPSGTPASSLGFYGGCTAYLNPVEDPAIVSDPINASIGCVDVIGYVSGGLDHLEGKEVIILADGEVIEGHTVISSAIYPALDHSYASVTVGLPYDSDMITLGTEDD